MAEKGSDTTGKKLLSFVAKRSKRVQEKMMQKMGKSEQTKDEVYTEFVVNFNKQQLAASRLNKELEKHMKALKILSQSSKALLDLWSELYEPDWKGHSDFQDILQQKLLLYNDVIDRTGSQVIESMHLYLAKFPETKKRVEKRERKVVDFDAARREMDSARQKPNPNPAKVQQAEDNFQRAKQAFDEVADELYEELPALYDSRIQFYATLFQSVANNEAKYHDEMAKIDVRFAEVMEELGAEAETGVYTSRKERNLEASTALLNPIKSSIEDEEMSISQSEEGEEGAALSETNVSAQDTSTPTSPTRSLEAEKTSKPDKPPAPSKPPKPSRSSAAHSPEPTSHVDAPTEDEVFNQQPQPQEENKEDSPVANGDAKLPTEEENMEHQKEDKDEDEGEKDKDTSEATPFTVLYKVVATHTYTGEDEDELSFEKGTVILVVPYDDPEDDEDGWKVGVIEETGRKGLFPENFSKKI